ncbi:NifU family protein [Qaidamihabitans albus]|uniref:NifU family protein n=1 Tax=Qaidamihabitans albus TaxID=2795733 RepID=UPI0018F249BF|nr:NifU family protein [Qaidamihabitans albus]
MADATRLDDAEVRQRLARIDELLERVEQVPGPTAEAAIEAVQTLTEVYGEALARVLGAASPPLVERMVGDELLGHLLVLHDVHPDPLADRVERALDGIRPYIESNGGRVELAGIEDGVARVRLSGSGKGCSSSSTTVEEAVTESVLALAPELTRVEPVPDPAGEEAPSLIPVEALLSRTAGAGRNA